MSDRTNYLSELYSRAVEIQVRISDIENDPREDMPDDLIDECEELYVEQNQIEAEIENIEYMDDREYLRDQLCREDYE